MNKKLTMKFFIYRKKLIRNSVIVCYFLNFKINQFLLQCYMNIFKIIDSSKNVNDKICDATYNYNNSLNKYFNWFVEGKNIKIQLTSTKSNQLQ